MNNLNNQSCQFVPITDIVPESWKSWFFCAISEGAPFSWGDNNRTLVHATRLRQHIEDVLDIYLESEQDISVSDRETLMDILNYCSNKNIYIDLEN